MTTINERLIAAFERLPIVAILRGVTPTEVVPIGRALVDCGITLIEVPLNSPEPLRSIERLATELDGSAIIGAGTVLTATAVDQVADVGGQIAVAPNTSAAVIERALARDMVPMPGWATPSDAFTAYACGARYLKLFPAGTFGEQHVRAMKAVLPADARILAVGGVGSHNAAAWRAAGADGFGIGSELYKPGHTAQAVADNAASVCAALDSMRPTP